MVYEQIVKDVCSDSKYLKYCRHVLKDDRHKDLHQEFIIRFLKEDKAKIEDMFSKPRHVFDYWAVKVIRNMAIDIYRSNDLVLFDEMFDVESEETDKDPSEDCMIEAILNTDKDLSYDSYFKMISRVFSMYLKLKSYRKVATELSTEKVSISHTYVKRFCDEYKDIIRENIDVCHC